MKFRLKIPVLLLASVLAVSCNMSYNKVLKSTDPAFKLEKAKEYYTQGKYDKALPLFEENLALNKGLKNNEEVLYLYADAYYKLKDYTMAAFYFRNYTTSYPTGKRVEEAAYMVAKCYEQESPRYELDQTNTAKAIDQYQLFINRYPKSSKVAEANASIDGLRAKMHKKAYESAYLYYKIKQYQAAAVTFKALLKEYPDINDRAKVQLYVIKSLKAFADNSYHEKKLERYTDAAKECALFQENYPTSEYKAEVQEIYTSVLEQIKSLQEDGKTNSGKKERRN